MSFVDKSNFQKERKWYILSKNSHFVECSTVPLDINGSLADISDFGEDVVSEAGSASGGISSHDGSINDTDSNYITEPSIILAISSYTFNRRKVVAILYSRGSNCKAYNYHKVAGDNFWINISAIPRMQQCSINIVSLNEHMALNLNEYICSLNEHIPWMDIISLNDICFIERGYICLNELIRFLGMNIISCQNLIASNDYTFVNKYMFFE